MTLSEPRAKTAPHGGGAREMEDHGLPRGGRFNMFKLQGRNMLCHSNKLQSGWRTTLGAHLRRSYADLGLL
jgi:hypothetical protein